MQALQSLSAVLLLALVVLVPGAALLEALRVRRHLDGWLVVPAWTIASLAIWSALLAPALGLEQGYVLVLVVGAVLTVALGAVAAVRWRREAEPGTDPDPDPAAAPATDEVADRATAVGRPPHRDPVVLGVAALALLAAALGWIVGGSLYSDALYHVAQAIKLTSFSHPNFDNTLQYADGSAHPGYLVPTWQWVLGAVARMSGADPLTVAALLPVVTAPLSVLAAAGAARVLTGARAGALAGAGFWLAFAVLVTFPRFSSISNAAQPGTITLDIVLPATLAAALVAIWAPGREARRAALVLAGLGAATIGVLHVSYLLFLAVFGVGYAMVAGVAALARDVQVPWRRTLVAAAVVAGSGGAVLLAALPRLDDLQSFAAEVDEERVAAFAEALDKAEGAQVGVLFAGDLTHFHLRADYLVWSGGLAFAGLVLAAVLLLARRWPGAWLVSGATLLTLVLTQSEQLFPRIVALAGAAQGRRFDTALPIVLALSLGLVALVGWRRWPVGRAGVAATAAVGAVLAVLALSVPRLLDRNGEPVLPEWPVQAIAVATLVLLAGLLARGIVLRVRGRGQAAGTAGEEQEVEQLPGSEPGAQLERRACWMPVAGVVLTLVVVLLVASWEDVRRRGEANSGPVTRRGELEAFDPEVVAALRRLPQGSIVLSDVQLRSSFKLMALAPLYVVSSAPGHVANTPDNRIEERFEVVDDLFTRPRMPPNERARILRETGATAVLVRRVPAHDRVLEGMDSQARYKRTLETDEWVLYRRVALRGQRRGQSGRPPA